MIIYELYNSTTVIQCVSKELAEKILAMYDSDDCYDEHYKGLMLREVDIPDFEIIQEKKIDEEND